jgi:hypothetical protein
MRYVKRRFFQTLNPFASSRTARCLIGLGLVTLIGASTLVTAQVAARINGKYVGKIEANADAGLIYNLFMGDRDFDFRTELQLAEDTAGNVTGVAQFIDQKNRRSVGNPTGQHSGSRLRFAIPLRDNCAPIQVKALVSAEGDVLQFPASNQVVNCSGSGISVGVRIKLKAFTLAR